MQFVGDAVMAGVRRPVPAGRPRRPGHGGGRWRCTECSASSTRSGQGREREEFVLGIGLSTGKAAAALLGSEERLEYTLVGDTVNLSQRLQDMARPGGQTVLSEPTWTALTDRPRRRTARPSSSRAGPRLSPAYRIW